MNRTTHGVTAPEDNHPNEQKVRRKPQHI